MIPKKIAAARIKLSSKMPYLSTALWSMQPVETDAQITMGVDRYWRLYYNVEAIEQWSVNELTAAIAHEVMHLIRDHAGRATKQQLSPSLYNIASDCEINDDLRNQHLALPEGSLFPEDFNLEENKLAEWYYEQLGDQAQQMPQPSFGGSAGDGEPRDYELPPPDQINDDQPPGINNAQGDLIRNKTAKDVRDHQKSRGDVPESLKLWAEGHLDSKVNWRKILSALIRRAISHSRGMTDYSYQRPSRRRSSHGYVVLPGMIQPNVRVSVVIDTSGSMSEKELSMALTEVGGILKSHVGSNGIVVFSVDAAAGSAQKVFNKNKINLTGGGGTDMRVGIKAVEDQRPRPDFCVVITDGWTPWPSTPTRTNLIIALTDKSQVKSCPAYAKTVVIDG